MNSMAELEMRYGQIDEVRIVIILAPDAKLTLFLDGSSIFETQKTYQITECCWNDRP